MSCEGCQARQQEIDYLRQQVKDLGDRVLAAANPQAYAQVTGKPINPGSEASAYEHYTDDQGQTWVTLQGRSVRLEEFEKFLIERGGYIAHDGQFVSASEFKKVQDKMDEAFGGSPVIDQALNGSFRAQ